MAKYKRRRTLPTRSDLAARLVSIRDHAGLTQSVLANEVGVTPAMLARWEDGSRPIPAHAVGPICRLLGVTPNFFFGIATDQQLIIERRSAA